MQVSPWTLTADEINVYTVFTEIFMELYVENGEWDLAETSAMNYTRYVRPPWTVHGTYIRHELYTVRTSAMNYTRYVRPPWTIHGTYVRHELYTVESPL